MWKGSFGFDLQVQDFYSKTYNRRLSILTNSGKTDNGFSDFEMEVESRLRKSVLIRWPWAAQSASLILPVRQYSWNIYLYQSLNGKWNLENKKINSFLPESLCLALIDREFSPHLSMCTGLLGAEEKLCFKAYGPKNRELLSSVQTVLFFFSLKAQREKSPQGSSFVFFFTLEIFPYLCNVLTMLQLFFLPHQTWNIRRHYLSFSPFCSYQSFPIPGSDMQYP